MTKYKKISITAIITSSVLLIGLLCFVISLFKDIKTLNELVGDAYQVGGSFNIYIHSMIGVLIFQIVATFLAMIFAGASLINGIGESERTATALMIISFLVLALEKTISLFVVYSITKDYVGVANASFSGEDIFGAILLFVCIFTLIASLICISSESDSGCMGSGIVACICLFIFYIIGISEAGSLAPIITIFSIIFLMIAFVGGILVFVFFGSKETEVTKTYTPPKPTPTVVESSHSNNANRISYPKSETTEEAAKALIKLKKLLDEGVISQKEYDEGRKKHLQNL